MTYVCLRIVVSNTYCVVFLFSFSSSSVSYVASFYGLSFFDCPFDILQRLFTLKSVRDTVLVFTFLIIYSIFNKYSTHKKML